MNKIILIFLLNILVFAFAGCEGEKEEKPSATLQQREQYVLPPQEQKPNTNESPVQPKRQVIDKKTEQDVLALINENLEATEKEDKDGVLKTIHSKSPQRNSTLNGMDFVFANYDMEYKLDLAEVLEVYGDTAIVHYIQTTKAIRGQGFAGNTSEGVHLLIKEDNKWKIYRTDPIK